MPYVHHVLVSFPIALSVLAAVAHTVAWRRPANSFAALARPLTYLAALFAIPTAAAGLLSDEHFVEHGGAVTVVVGHRNAALAAALLLLTAAVASFLSTRRDGAATRVVNVALSLLAAAMVAVAAHRGGDMLHPGLAPWSEGAHGHGSPSAEPQEAPEQDAHPSVSSDPDRAKEEERKEEEGAHEEQRPAEHRQEATPPIRRERTFVPEAGPTSTIQPSRPSAGEHPAMSGSARTPEGKHEH